MPAIKKETTIKGFGPAIITEKVKDYANDPTFLKRAAEAKELLTNTDLSALKAKRV